jgi:hypothetical protein
LEDGEHSMMKVKTINVIPERLKRDG